MKIFTKKRVIWGVVIIVVGGFIASRIFGGGNPAEDIQTEKVQKQDLKQTVLATGQVVSTTDLQLAFKAGGFVERVNANEGNKVKAGQVLAELSNKDQLAALTQARGSLAQAQANYNRVLAGSSNEEVTVYQVALDNARSSLEITKKQQQVLVDNSYKALLNSALATVAGTGNTGSVTATVSGSYIGTEQGIYKITIYSTGNGLYFQVSGLESGSGQVSTIPQPMGTKGLYIQFSSTSVPDNNTWTVSIPNTLATTYVTNYNAYQSALETRAAALSAAENAVVSAQANLDLKKAQARPADVQSAQAQILSAQGQVLAAQSGLDNTRVIAPADGTITEVNIKKGEQATSLKTIMVLQDVGSLHVEANVSEANIATLSSGQEVDITFDSLGTDRHFKGKIQTVNPASTVVSGVVNYKITVSIEQMPEIKPGMTANLTVNVSEKQQVLSVPQRAIISKDRKKFVRIVTDSNTKAYEEREVVTGLEADESRVEILSGLSEGDEVVTFIKK